MAVSASARATLRVVLRVLAGFALGAAAAYVVELLRPRPASDYARGEAATYGAPEPPEAAARATTSGHDEEA